MLETISGLSGVSAIPDVQPTASVATNQVSGTRFVDWVSNEVSVVNDQINTAELNLRELAAGQTDNLHQVMISLNKAKLSFEMMVEVRNKMLEGYQEIMRMQV